jgi:hypothetical protein
MRMVRPLVLALALGAAAAPRTAEAATYRLGLGANYWFEESGVFDFTLGISTRVARRLSVGGRLGAAIVTEPSTAAIPLDVVLRGEFPRVYLEALGGPWILFKGDAVRGHFAMGLGVRSRGISAGVEVGYLDPNAIIGFKLAFVL